MREEPRRLIQPCRVPAVEPAPDPVERRRRRERTIQGAGLVLSVLFASAASWTTWRTVCLVSPMRAQLVRDAEVMRLDAHAIQQLRAVNEILVRSCGAIQE